MNIFSLFKGGRGGPLPVAFPALLESLGVKAEVLELPAEQHPAAFQAAVRTTKQRGAEVVRLIGQMPDGSRVHALMIMTPAPEIHGSVSPDRVTTEVVTKDHLTRTIPAAL